MGQPHAVSGGLLHLIGSNAVRRPVGQTCRPYGYNAHCMKTGGARLSVPWPGVLTVPNASWHFSSASGGPDGFVAKMEANAEGMRSARKRAADGSLARDVATCFEHENKNSSRKKGSSARRGNVFVRTGWGLNGPLPRYPDVPRTLELSLAKGLLPSFRGDWGWTALDGGHGAPHTGSTPHLLTLTHVGHVPTAAQAA